MATVRELSLKISHASGESTTLKFSPLADIYELSGGNVSDAEVYKFRIGQINSGRIEEDYSSSGSKSPLATPLSVGYQGQLLSKNGSPAASISAATFTTTVTTRIWTRGN